MFSLLKIHNFQLNIFKCSVQVQKKYLRSKTFYSFQVENLLLR